MDIVKEKNTDTKIIELRKIIADQADEISQLKNIISNVPGDVYWKNKDGVWLGLNTIASKNLCDMGFSWKTHDVVGKTDYELFKKETADEFRRNDLKVIQDRVEVTQEEVAILPSGEKIIQLSTKRPLLDSNDQVVGVIGITINITAEKEAERLKLENEKHKVQLAEKEKFAQIASQVAHDIRSPLASLLMVVKSCNDIPETERVALREAAIRIDDIANHLLSQYKAKKTDTVFTTAGREPLLASAALLQLLTEKKYEYHNALIKWNHEFNSEGHFSFIKIESSAFKRMISNLINNAIDAFDGKTGEITVKLEGGPEWVKIIVEDNGKGMPPELIEKIMGNVSVTAGKKTGHGIGLTQVRDTLQRNQGEISINSVLGRGTQVMLTFPRTKAPHWIAEKIQLSGSDIVVILDDDHSIHSAWRIRFELIFKQTPDIQLKNFILASAALDFFESLSSDQKEKIFLLADYELLKQELNGLDVIKKSKIQRSILVTSHSTNPRVRDQASQIGIKILPKQLASEIPILIAEAITNGKKEDVYAIIVDDDQHFSESLSLFAFSDHEVDLYHDPRHFLDNVSRYPKDIKIYLDNNFKMSDLKGLDVTKQLHQQGYTQLYLLSGEDFERDAIPSYLTVIGKNDLDSIKNSVLT